MSAYVDHSLNPRTLNLSHQEELFYQMKESLYHYVIFHLNCKRLSLLILKTILYTILQPRQRNKKDEAFQHSSCQLE